MVQYKMFWFIKKTIIAAMTFFNCNVLNVNPLKFVPINNQERKLRPEIINVSSNETIFILTVLV